MLIRRPNPAVQGKTAAQRGCSWDCVQNCSGPRLYPGLSGLFTVEAPKSSLTPPIADTGAGLGATELTGCSLTTMTSAWGAGRRGRLLLQEQKTLLLSPSPPWKATKFKVSG